MNRYAKELHYELETLCKKYQIQKGILLFEDEKDINQPKPKYRAIIFKPGIVDKHWNACEFAEMVFQCINSSKTFMKIVLHMNDHSINHMISDMEQEHKLHSKRTPDD